MLGSLRLTQPTPRPTGGGKRDRTADLLVANQTLSQLSYTPVTNYRYSIMVGLERFELSTPRLSSVCSNQLSYRPENTSNRYRRNPKGLPYVKDILP